MTKTLKSVLSMVLALTMIFSSAATVLAGGNGQASGINSEASAGRKLDIEEIDPSTLNIKRLGDADVSAETEIEAPQYGLNDTVRVSILLEAPSAIDAGYEIQGIGKNNEALAYRKTLRAQQNAMAQQISQQILGGAALQVKWNITLAGNMISAYVPFGKIDAIKALDGVADVILENRYDPVVTEKGGEPDHPNMISARDMTGTSLPYASEYTGAGSRLAIIDTGLDTDHQSYDPEAFLHAIEEDQAAGKTVVLMTEDDIPAEGLNGKGIYLNAKLPYIYNYVDENTTVNHLNDTQEEHGSHVAGIAAANRYLKKGEEFVEAAKEVGVVGQAPDAQVFIMKVFGAGGGAYDSDYMVAIEDALMLGADSVNLSLGSSAPGPATITNGTYRGIFQNLVGKGLVVSISAGNNTSWDSQKQLYSDDINLNTGGSPGSFANSLTVASIDDSGTKAPFLLFNENLELRYMDGGGAANNAPMITIAGDYEYVYIDGPGVNDNANVGLEGDQFLALGSEVVSGKVALCNRGTSSFFAKANAAVAQGAVGVIIVNNQPGTISMALDGYSYTNPVASIKQAEGEAIKEGGEAHTSGDITYYTGKITVGGEDNKTPVAFYEMSSFSSWGTSGSLIMKPEITAPGGSVYSLNGYHRAVTGGYAGGNDQYELMSGTSMAAPQITGITAVIGEHYRADDLAAKTGVSFRTFAESVIMSTAVPVKEEASKNYYSILNQGAGLVDVNAAVQAKTFILMDKAATRSAADGKVKAELGDDPSRTGTYTYSFTIKNFGDEDIVYEVNTDLFTQALAGDNKLLAHQVTNLENSAQVDWVVGPYARDVNIDGVTNSLDAQAIVDKVTGALAEEAPFDAEAADMDGDEAITSYDAYLLLDKMKNTSYEGNTVPAGSYATVTVTLKLTDAQKAALDNSPRKGAYVEGYTFLKGDDGVTHHIPILGFYGSWTDPSMYDAVTYIEKLYGSEQSSYFLAANANTNLLNIRYNGATTETTFTGNPYVVEKEFPEDRVALNSKSTLYQARYNLIRPAGTLFTAVTKEDGSIISLGSVGSNMNAAYFNTQANTPSWVSTSTSSANINVAVGSLGLKEGDKFTAGIYALPEYYAFEANDTNDSGYQLNQAQVRELLASGEIGEGAFLGYTFMLDDTAPEAEGVQNEDGTITVTAKDNQYIAAIGVLDVSGKKQFVPMFTPEQTAAGQEVTYTFDPVAIGAAAANAATIFVADYAGNEYAIVVRTGEGPIIVDKEAYILTSEVTDGKEYLIASVNEAGNGNILNRSNTAVQGPAVKVYAPNDRFAVPFIDGDDVVATEVWTFTASGDAGQFWKILNGNYYLRQSRGNISISGTNNNNEWTWDAENNRLSIVYNNGTRYLRFYNNNFSINQAENSVYLYEKVTYSEEIDPFTVNSITLTPESANLYTGNKLQILAEVMPMTAEDKTLIWSSSDEAVATVDQTGLVTAVGAGDAVITAASASAEGVFAATKINVVAVTSMPGVTVNAQLVDSTGANFVRLDLGDMSVEPLGECAGALYGGGRSEDVIMGFMSNGNVVETIISDEGYSSEILGSFGSTQYNARDGAHMPPLVAETEEGTVKEEFISIYFSQDNLWLFTPDYGLTGWNFEGNSAITYAGSLTETSQHFFYMLDGDGQMFIGIIGVDDEEPVTEEGINALLMTGEPTPIEGLSAEAGTFDANAMSISLLDNGDYYGLLVANSNNRRIYFVDLMADTLEAVLVAGFNGTSLTTLYNDDYDAEVIPLQSEAAKTFIAGAKETLSTPVRAQKLAVLDKKDQAAGGLNRTGASYTASALQNAELVPASEQLDPQAVPVTSQVTVAVVEAEDVTNGKYTLTYDAEKLTFKKAEISGEVGSVFADAENGVVTLAFADLDGITAGKTIANVFFDQPECEGSTITVATDERNEVLEGIEEDFDLEVKGPGHVWGEPEWTWTKTEDGYTASATFVCETNEAHTVTVEAEVTVEKEAGKTTYTAVAELDGRTYTDVLVETASHVRAYGESYYKTSFVIANRLKAELGVDKFDAIVVARGTGESGFADALGGSYLAAKEGAPVLLIAGAEDEDEAEVRKAVEEYITDNLNKDGKVYILGGTSAISEAFETELETAGVSTKRFAGSNRWYTNIDILNYTGIEAGEEVIVVEANKSYADSLSAASVGKPIFLVNGATETLRKEQTAFLEELKAKGVTFTVLGGEAAVIPAKYDLIASYGETRRVAGADRYLTSVEVAKEYYKDAETIIIFNGTNTNGYGDGLISGALAAAMKAPMILTRNNEKTTVEINKQYVGELDLNKVYVVGNDEVVTDASVLQITGLESMDDFVIFTE